jgi:DNA gyrase subunit B
LISGDFREGLTAIISVKVAEPQFEGQTKRNWKQSFMSEMIENYLEENPNDARIIVQK